MDPVQAFDWAAYLKECAALAVDAAIWVMLARLIGRALRGVGRG